MTRLVVALFSLIRISTPHQTYLDRLCSSLASPPSPTPPYASCTSSLSMWSIIAASALPGPPGQGQPSQEGLAPVCCSSTKYLFITITLQFEAAHGKALLLLVHHRPPCPPMLQTHSLSLFILYAFLLLQNSSGGMKCVKFGGWKSAGMKWYTTVKWVLEKQHTKIWRKEITSIQNHKNVLSYKSIIVIGHLIDIIWKNSKCFSPLGDLCCLSCEESFGGSFLVHRLTFSRIYSQN